MNPTEHLSYAERIARIGQLLSKGITLLLLDEAEEKRRGVAAGANSGSAAGVNGSPKENDFVPNVDDDVERAIYEYLMRVHSASPRDIMRGLELSKATAFRKLAHLCEANLITRSGKTAAIRYRLAPLVTKPQPGESSVRELVVEAELKQL